MKLFIETGGGVDGAAGQARAVLGRLGLPLRVSTMERVFWTGIAIMVGMTLLFEGIRWVESNVFGVLAPHRFVGNGSEAAMRYITLPHFILAFLFSVTAARNQTRRRRSLLGGLLLGGLAFCWGYSMVTPMLAGWLLVGRQESTVGLLIVLPYFLWHEMRDEAFFYRLLGEGSSVRDTAHLSRLVRALIGFTLFTLFAILCGLMTLGVTPGLNPDLVTAAPRGPVIGLLALSILIGAGGMAVAVRRFARAESLRPSEVLRRHGPLFRVYGGLFVTISAGLAITGRGHTLALSHVCIWYVFICHTLKKRSTAVTAAPGSWPWLRGTVPGFRCLHHGTVLLLVGLGVYWVYGLQQQGWLWYLLSPYAFYYWTIVHITISFQPR